MEEQNTKKQKFIKRPEVQSILGVVIIALLLGGFIFWQSTRNTIFIENSHIDAPIINLSATTPGTLNALYVKEGQTIQANTPVALVGTNIVVSKQSGIVVSIQNNVGEYFVPGETIVSMVHPEDMRVIGALDENKGLDEIHAGQKITFTVDTFGNKIYTGTVESVSATADNTGVLFSISDKRPTEKFDVKATFDVANYPELKNGMSAKMTVYTQ